VRKNPKAIAKTIRAEVA